MIRVHGPRTWRLALSVCACGLLVVRVRQRGATRHLGAVVTLGSELPAILSYRNCGAEQRIRCT